MARLNDFPNQIPEAVRVHFTGLQAAVVYMFTQERMTQAEIGQELDPTRSRRSVGRILDRALAKIESDPGRSYVRSMGEGDEDKVVAMA